jgi:hypothetical protein
MVGGGLLDLAKVREDTSLSQATRAEITKVVEREADKDVKRKLPRRPRCQLVEMLILRGISQYWQEETTAGETHA